MLVISFSVVCGTSHNSSWLESYGHEKLETPGLGNEISMQVRKHIQVSVVNNSSCGSLYFGNYTPWKIGFVASPEDSQNQVFRVKTS